MALRTGNQTITSLVIMEEMWNAYTVLARNIEERLGVNQIALQGMSWKSGLGSCGLS